MQTREIALLPAEKVMSKNARAWDCGHLPLVLTDIVSTSWRSLLQNFAKCMVSCALCFVFLFMSFVLALNSCSPRAAAGCDSAKQSSRRMGMKANYDERSNFLLSGRNWPAMKTLNLDHHSA